MEANISLLQGLEEVRVTGGRHGT